MSFFFVKVMAKACYGYKIFAHVFVSFVLISLYFASGRSVIPLKRLRWKYSNSVAMLVLLASNRTWWSESYGNVVTSIPVSL